MYDVVDLYIELLDEKESNRIIKNFNLKVKGFKTAVKAPAQMKKNEIKQFFKMQGRKFKKNAASPFMHFIEYGYKPELFKDLAYEEMKIKLGDMDSIKDYEKLAVLSFHYPQETVDLLPALQEKYEAGKPLFEIEHSFETEEDVKKFLKMKWFQEPKKLVVIFAKQDVVRNIMERQYSDLDEALDAVKDLNLIDFFNKVNELRNGFDEKLLYYAFLVTQDDLPLEIAFSIGATLLIDCLMAVSEELDDSVEENISNDMALDEIAELKVNNKELTAQIKTYETDIKDLKRDKRQADKELKRYGGTMQALERRIAALEEDKETSESTIQQLKKESTKKDEAISELKKIHKVKLKKAIDQTKQELFNDFIGTNTTDVYDDFSIIGVKMEDHLFDFYPEINLMRYGDFDVKKNELLEKRIKTIYLNRFAMRSKWVDKVENFAREYGIKFHTFIAKSSKELIENIGCFKRGGI